ncbi:hypothetical protein EVAR_79590_1 [Eumeta japonica]|uniref:Uncharacterized protein n=1 Tax=Eumeta variegata TaxID=151549 RepID=A0A4C1UE40_EUMVA|nr:hypothetical protein EVAR_79590_1 [Eumeta japonica]
MWANNGVISLGGSESRPCSGNPAYPSAKFVTFVLSNDQTGSNKMKWTKIITEWQPCDGKRKRSRQVRRWTDDIKMIRGTIWSRKATNREEWKQLEEALCHRTR